jgi:Protein of unknown function (DUF3429)
VIRSSRFTLPVVMSASTDPSFIQWPGRGAAVPGLGWAGVLPFGLLTAAAVFQINLPAFEARELLVDYGAVILSFMGGVQWGLAMTRSHKDGIGGQGYAISVLPALLGFVAAQSAPVIALPVLVIGFCGLLAFDLWTVREGLAPVWYRSLRWQLTIAVVVCLMSAWLL